VEESAEATIRGQLGLSAHRGRAGRDRARHLKTGPAALLPQAPIRIHASPRTRHPSVIARASMKIRVQAIHREASASGPLHPEQQAGAAKGSVTAALSTPTLARYGASPAPISTPSSTNT